MYSSPGVRLLITNRPSGPIRPCVYAPVMPETASASGSLRLRAMTLMPLYSVLPSLSRSVPVIDPRLSK